MARRHGSNTTRALPHMSLLHRFICLAIAALAVGCAGAQDSTPQPAVQSDKPAGEPIVSQQAPYDVEIITDKSGKRITIFKHRGKKMDPGRDKTPDPPRTFEPGPPIRPRGPLMEWLDDFSRMTKWDRRVKVPVVIRMDKGHLGIIEAFIGVTDTVDAETIFLRLDDSWMGISLMDRLGKPCPRANPTCVIWLEGYWANGLQHGLRIPHPDQDGVDRTKWPFRAMRVHERIEGELNGAEVRAQFEIPSAMSETKP